MSKRKLSLLTVFLLLLAGILAVPAVLKAVPSRYVARLPQPLQQLGMPDDQAPILPTVARPADADTLLQPADTVKAAEMSATEMAPPDTPTPPPAADVTSVLPPTFTPAATPTPADTPVPIPQTTRLDGFQHQFQSWNNCGPATMAMTLSYFDLHLTQSQTAAVLKPNPEDRNVSPHEMAAYVNKETPFAATWRVNGNLDTVRRLVANDIPVLLEIGIEPSGEYRWMGWYGHYLLVVAYDDVQRQFWVYDSWFGTSDVPMENADKEGRMLPYTEVEEYWPQFNRTYIAVYRPEQASTAADIIGADMDDDVMWQNALVRVQADTAARPNNAFSWFNLGTVYNALGQYEEAATAFDQARSIGLPWRMLWYQFGPYEAYYEVGRYEDVVLLADTTLKDRPYFEESFYYKGLALAALGSTDEARQNLERAIDFNPNFAPATTALNNLESGS